MKLVHAALWTDDLERSRAFYETYFGGTGNEKYVNPKKGFASYFLTFEGGAALEIMQRTDVSERIPGSKEYIGLAHIAFSVGTRADVDVMIERLSKDGYLIVGEPRQTGDGFYEGAFLDPDGNRVEVVADTE